MRKSSEVLRILYRGPLSSCTMSCGYCPFDKVALGEDDLARDFASLERFEDAITALDRSVAVFFTPWGEALVHRAYREALARLSHLEHVQRVVAQTHGSWPLEWLEDADPGKLALSITWHPSELTRSRLVRLVSKLRELGIACSVGIVGIREHFSAARTLRQSLPPETYVWINANKGLVPPYTQEEIGALSRIDPLFPVNQAVQDTAGQTCGTGHGVVAVDGRLRVRRCWFVEGDLGVHLGEPGWTEALKPRPCPADGCRCHIGYVHAPAVGLGEIFGDGILERIPTREWKGWGVLSAERR